VAKRPRIPPAHHAVAAHLAVAAATLVLWFVPLYGHLGFEFAAAMGFVLAYVAGLRAAVLGRAAQPAPGADPCPFPGGVLRRATLEHLSLLATPILLMGLRAWAAPACDVALGLRFYAVLAVPAVLYGTAIGFACGLGARRPRAAFLLWSVATYVAAIAFLLAEPPKFAYNAFVGFFPGPLYDTEIPFDARLVLARTLVVAEALAVTLWTMLAWDGRRAVLTYAGRHWRDERAVLGGATALLVAALVLVQFFAAPLGLRIGRGFIQRTLGGRIETAHVRLYYDRATIPEARARELAVQHEARFEQLQEFFGCAPGRRIGSYVYASAEQKKRLMGAGGTSFEDALNDEFHINASSEDPHPVLTHEMAHIFAAQLDAWAPVCWKIGIHEGIAVAAEWADESARLELTPHEACAAMDSLGLLPDLERAMSAWGFWSLPGARAYTACGSFVRYLVDTYGMERFRRLWRRGDFEVAYGKPLDRLADEWRAVLRRTPPSAAQLRRADRLFRAPAIFSVPCAHDVAQIESEAARAAAGGDAARAESLYARLTAMDAGNAAHAIDWARARFTRGDAVGALDMARTLAADSTRGAAARDRAWRLCGDTAWARGDSAAARRFYARGAAAATSTADARAYEVLELALGLGAAAAPLRAYLTPAGTSDVAALAWLAQARLAAPAAPLPRYLLGRRLVLAHEPAQGALELDAALAGGAGLGAEATLAARELRARAAFATGDRAAAAERFEALAATPQLPAWRQLGFLDWAGRCRAVVPVVRVEQ